MLDAAQHDRIFAAVSHLPHLLAFALVDDAGAAGADSDIFFSFAASGFRDFTRIAASSPEMWRDIALANREALLAELDAYIAAKLEALTAAVDAEDADALLKMFSRARDAREHWIVTQEYYDENFSICTAKARARHGQAAGFQKHFQPRAAAVRAGDRHDRGASDLLDSDDTRVMLDALRALGVGVERHGDSDDYAISGVGGAFPVKHAELFLGNAGTAFRSLTAALRAVRRRISAVRRARACTSGRSAIWSMRCGNSVRADRLSGQ